MAPFVLDTVYILNDVGALACMYVYASHVHLFIFICVSFKLYLGTYNVDYYRTQLTAVNCERFCFWRRQSVVFCLCMKYLGNR